MAFAVVAAAIAAVACVVVWRITARARLLSERARVLEADLLEPFSGTTSVAVARATHLRTLAGPHDACLRDFAPGVRGELLVTERELVLAGAWHLPIARLTEVGFVRSFEREQAGPEATLLRLGWRRAGLSLVTVVRVEGRRVDAERIRKELHLRLTGRTGA